MEEKLYTLVFTDSELNTIYDALIELKLCTDSDEELERISSIQDKIYQECK